MNADSSQTTRTLRCPVCGQMFLREQSTAMPFCSSRCRQIDLGRWLDEGIGVPVVPDPDDPEAWDLADDEPQGY